MKTRYLCGFVLASDAVMLLGGVPLMRYTWLAIARQADTSVLLLLLVANLTLLGLCLCAMLASAVAAQRGARFAFTRLSRRFFAQRSRAS